MPNRRYVLNRLKTRTAWAANFAEYGNDQRAVMG